MPFAVMFSFQGFVQREEQCCEWNGEHVPDEVAGFGRANAHFAGTLSCFVAAANY